PPTSRLFPYTTLFRSLRLLGQMRMRIAAINFQLPINGSTQTVVRDHSAHRALDQQLRMTSTARLHRFRFMATDITGEAHVRFALDRKSTRLNSSHRTI